MPHNRLLQSEFNRTSGNQKSRANGCQLLCSFFPVLCLRAVISRIGVLTTLGQNTTDGVCRVSWLFFSAHSASLPGFATQTHARALSPHTSSCCMHVVRGSDCASVFGVVVGSTAIHVLCAQREYRTRLFREHLLSTYSSFFSVEWPHPNNETYRSKVGHSHFVSSSSLFPPLSLLLLLLPVVAVVVLLLLLQRSTLHTHTLSLPPPSLSPWLQTTAHPRRHPQPAHPRDVLFMCYPGPRTSISRCPQCPSQVCLLSALLRRSMAHTRTHTLSLSLTHSLTHTLSHSHTHTHTLSLSRSTCSFWMATFAASIESDLPARLPGMHSPANLSSTYVPTSKPAFVFEIGSEPQLPTP